MDDLKDKSFIKMTSHLLIRDKKSGQIIVNKSQNAPLKKNKTLANVEKKDE